MPTSPAEAAYVQIVTFEVDDADKQRALLAGITAAVEGWIPTLPGFISASFHLSHDGTKLLNYARWESRAAFERFGADERRRWTQEAISAVGIRSMTAQGYSVARVIHPAGPRDDASLG